MDQEASHNKLLLVDKIEDKELGFRDFILIPELKLLVAGKSKMDVVKRVGAYIQNAMPWAKGDDDNTDISKKIGSISMALINLNQKGSSQSRKVINKWEHPLNTQLICIALSLSRAIVAAGCDNGKIFVFQFNKRTFELEKILLDKNIHKARIMSIRIDPVQQIIYSVGEDRKLCVTSITLREVIYSMISII